MMSPRLLSILVAALFSALGVFALWYYVIAEKLGFKLSPNDTVAPIEQPEQSVAPELNGEATAPSLVPSTDEPSTDEPITDEPSTDAPSTDESLQEQGLLILEVEDTTLTQPEKIPAEPEPTSPTLPDMQGSQGARNLVDTISNILNAGGEVDEAPAQGAGSSRKDEAQELLTALQEQNLIKAEDAATLNEWKKNNKLVRVEPVGTFMKDGKTISRYRLVGDKGQDLLLDMEQPEEASTPWKVARLSPAAPADMMDALDLTDSMQVVEGFINAVRTGEMSEARSYITGSLVSDVTIAGLCMVFAESGYHLRDNKPIRSSFQNANNAAYLVYLQEEQKNVPVNVGIELKNIEGWHVSAVALDALLGSYEKSADDEGGRYFPLVKNPRGGDSIALFFAFDDSNLTPRSMSQLKIVAELLQPEERRLDISGHTDDVGGEAYNEKLSLRRAEAVKEALISYGVDASKISTEGMGMRQPRRAYSPKQEPEMLETERAENRRAEIYLDFQ